MDPPHIEFPDDLTTSKTFQRTDSILFTKFDSFFHEPPMRKNSIGLTQKKSKSSNKQTPEPSAILTSFQVNFSLLRLLRQPHITDKHQFQFIYLSDVAIELNEYDREVDCVLFFHLLLSQVSNIDEIVELGEQRFNLKEVGQAWNKTNIMNVKCLLANINRADVRQYIGEKGNIQRKTKESTEGLTITLVETKYVNNMFENTLTFSIKYMQMALQSNGHMDIYFAPFLFSEFSVEVALWQFSVEDNGYANIFLQIVKEKQLFEETQFATWFDNQLDRLVNKQFSISELKQLLALGENPLIQKLLIGLLGWEGQSQEAIRLLNALYDGADWQINEQFTAPSVSECLSPFSINYLIEKIAQIQQLVICVKAPCFNSYYAGECFSWHRPVITQYGSEEQHYLWLQLHLGPFLKCGFYDWTLFKLNNQGKQYVNKIIDMNNVTTLASKAVKGRFIVHPQKVRQLQLHQLDIDSINSDQNIYKHSKFEDVTKLIEPLSKEGINCFYVMGVFERDTHTRDPSPLAFTNRSMPASNLGGQVAFRNMVEQAHRRNTKIIVDCTTRVGTNQMGRLYESLKLNYIDPQGKKQYLYGANGRCINHEDTTVLNYRKKEAWDLFIQEIITIVDKYQIDGIYLDNGFEWPQTYCINEQEMLRSGRYTNLQIFHGQIVTPQKIVGYHASKIVSKYPNPFLIKLCKALWGRYPQFLIVCEGLDYHSDLKMASVIKSGPIPRIFKMPKALALVVGMQLHGNGFINPVAPKTMNSLRKWYLQVNRLLPKNAIVINSTTYPTWPYLSFIFKKATWAVIDLLFFLPDLTMTYGFEQNGKAYFTKSVNISYVHTEIEKHEPTKEKNDLSLNQVASTFFTTDGDKHNVGIVQLGFNSTVKDPSQIYPLSEWLRKEVGPEFGFDLLQIYKHYRHRRQLRKNTALLTSGNMCAISANHMYGVHTNVLSFAKYNEGQILMISINFNVGPIDMHYGLSAIKILFKNFQRSCLVIQIQDMLNPLRFVNEYYTVSELLSSRLEAHIQAYKSQILRLVIKKDAQSLKLALKCSQRRMIERVSKEPPQWIYSSVFLSELSYVLEKANHTKSIVSSLNSLYEQFVFPAKLNFSLIISKAYDFYLNKSKLEKLFGVLKLIEASDGLNQHLRGSIQNLLSGNRLGPIAFVTPQIGAWSSIGGLGVMVDELSKELIKLGEQVYIITPYYEYNKKNQTNYLLRDGFKYDRNITVVADKFTYEFGIHCGKKAGVNFIWFHNPQLFSKPYDGQGVEYVCRQLVFFALVSLEVCCQLKTFPSMMVTNDWMCGFVSAYVKIGKFNEVFRGTKFIHIVHNLDPLYMGRIYPKDDFNWLIRLPPAWYCETIDGKFMINPSKCALSSCDNWGTVSNSYKFDLLKQSPLASVLWKHPHPFSFPNGIQKVERLAVLMTKTPGNHIQSKALIQKKYFKIDVPREDIPLFSFVGRITKQKGVKLILDAVEPFLYETNFKIQIIVAGQADPKEEYSKECRDKMKELNQRYPQCFWSDPDLFFTDGPLLNIGSDYAMMPSLFEPGGIVQHEFFCGSTPVIAFRTGGLKDTVFEFDPKSYKGNGFNFMSYDVEDFKRCLRRAISCFSNREAYLKLRENAFDSVVEQEDVAKGWNNEFYRLQNKIYIDWDKVDKTVQSFSSSQQDLNEKDFRVLDYTGGEYWNKQWDYIAKFKEVLRDSSRLKGKYYKFLYETRKMPWPKQVLIVGSWDDWKGQVKMNFDKIQKHYQISLKLKPGTFNYKYFVDGEWLLNQNTEKEVDINGNENHIIRVE